MKISLRDKILQSTKDLAKKYSKLEIKDLLETSRLEKFKVTTEYLSLDYSKQRLNEEILGHLLEIPDEINLSQSIDNISSGNFVNSTEERLVSHMLYRSSNNLTNNSGLRDIHKQKEKLKNFVDNFILKFKDIETVISIGIGGSRLGPELLSEVNNTAVDLNILYCSSYDLVELENVLAQQNPYKTLIVISSKSFTTPEVLSNANKAKDWLNNSIGDQSHLNLLGISSNTEAMDNFGILKENQFEILDTLGGRYSIWSSISLPAILDMGWSKYEEFLEGAYLADKHFSSSSWRENIPVLMALMSYWNTNGLAINNLGIFSYDYKIRSLTKYLSQMGMESNGKSYSSEGEKTTSYNCPLIWGGYGPDAQHSVFQWLLQGSDFTSCDFIGSTDTIKSTESYQMLLAQITALSLGEDNKEFKYKSVNGNNPVNLLKLNKIDARSIGFLLACYEHKVFVESQIYGINPFDQWGVQLGKKLTIKSSQDGNFMDQYFNKDFLL